MRMFNADGSEGRMCGNAIRCVAKYLYDNGMVRKADMKIDTMSGVRELRLTIANGEVASVRVNMGRARFEPSEIPVLAQGDSVISKPVIIGGAEYAITCVSMGNPHAVVFIKGADIAAGAYGEANCPTRSGGLDTLDLRAIGPLFEHDAMFPDRVNAEFVEVLGQNSLKARVWERGSGETQACGTGACAVVAAAVANGLCGIGADVSVRLPGGELIINYTDEAVYMTGDCVRVFEGAVDIGGS
ncbi:MAG: diaminopimelate epimerase [Oscillospiraceae bacterium]|nr:diaminopimelate epimerase [Oscillospiraceae bacterium]